MKKNRTQSKAIGIRKHHAVHGQLRAHEPPNGTKLTKRRKDHFEKPSGS
eukprot:SAG11_NODE_121_length_15851_cov_6.082466_14_plen_49_part_00